MPLPPLIEYIPHENLFKLWLIILLKSGVQEEFDYVLRTENPAFWKDRIGNSGRGEPGDLLLALRSKAPIVIGANRPEFAVGWLSSILERPEEPDSYKTVVTHLLQRAQERVAGVHPPPVHGHPPILLPSSFPPAQYDLLPVLDQRRLRDLLPRSESLWRSGEITEDTYRQCKDLSSNKELDAAERLTICRSLTSQDNLPFEVKRWAFMYHVLEAGGLDLVDEMEAVAHQWLNAYPTDWEHLPESWRHTRYKEFNANVFLRG
jgi:hypothetical protein